MSAWWGRLLWDETGSVDALDWAFVATLLVLGAITGAVASRQAVLEPTEPPPAHAR
jgi:hypothetical protein